MQTRAKEPSAIDISTSGLDLAKNILQVHAVSSTSELVVRKALRRLPMLPSFAQPPTCQVDAEVGGTSHHWAGEPTKL